MTAAEAAQDHLEKTLAKHPVFSHGHRALDRQLKQEQRLLALYAKEALILGADEVAAALDLAADAVDDARTYLAADHYFKESQKA